MSTNGNGRFAGKVVFATGAGNGIGRATAIAFAREGATVVAADLSEEHSCDTVQSIEQLRGNVMAVSCDITSSEQVAAALQRAVDAFGRIDIAFNNAGVEQRTALVAEHLLRRQGQGIRWRSRVRRLEVRRHRTDQVCRLRLRRLKHPHQRHLPRPHRHPDDRTHRRRQAPIDVTRSSRKNRSADSAPSTK